MVVDLAHERVAGYGPTPRLARGPPVRDGRTDTSDGSDDRTRRGASSLGPIPTASDPVGEGDGTDSDADPRARTYQRTNS